jgi:hypothetical protein
MHSIEELNTKIWYRLLKVLYFLALLVIVGITLIICWSDASYTPFNPAQFGATPAGGGQLNINQLNPSDYTVNNDVGFVPDTQFNPTSLPGVVPVSAPTVPLAVRFAEEAIPALLIELLLFEFLRRLFYYVSLGSWRPKK